MLKKRDPLKIILLLLLICCFGPALSLSALAAEPPIILEVNGQKIAPDVDPFLHNGYTLAPLRFVATPLNADFSWDEASQTATMNKAGLVISLTVDSKTALVNGNPTPLDVPAMLRQGRIFVPVRFVSQQMGAQVEWVSESRTVRIVFPDLPIVPSGLKVAGYYYDSNSLPMLKNFPNTFDQIIHFAYEMLEDGRVKAKSSFDRDLFEQEARDIANTYGIEALLLVTGQTKSVSDAFLASPEARSAGVANLVQLVEERGLAGVDLDFEVVSEIYRDNFTAFVRELKGALGPGKKVSLSAMPKSDDRETWLNGYDYAALAKIADQIIIMCYNQHYSGGDPGPVAGLDWAERVIKYLLNYIPKGKMILGLGGYGYSWPENGAGASIHIDRAYELAKEYGAEIKRDPVADVPWFEYLDKEGAQRQLWFEDARSLSKKAALAKNYDLAGIGIWRMGIIPNDIWEAIMQAIK